MNIDQESSEKLTMFTKINNFNGTWTNNKKIIIFLILTYWPKMTFDLDFVTWNLRHKICDTW